MAEDRIEPEAMSNRGCERCLGAMTRQLSSNGDPSV